MNNEQTENRPITEDETKTIEELLKQLASEYILSMM